MKLVIAPDSFKESLSAKEVCQALASGWREVWPETEIALAPMADGGEGTAEAAVDASGGEWIEHEVSGPLGEPVTARYGSLDGGGTAVIEMASAAGLALVPERRRDPMKTTTRGLGELIRHALDRGAERIVIGLGGSATCDGGVGMAQALGYQLLDDDDSSIGPGGGALANLRRVESGELAKGLREAEIVAACDVRNPLLGDQGAAAVFAPQKGASVEDVGELERGLAILAEVVERDRGVSVVELEGGGAAGGLGAGLVAFAGAQLQRGVDVVAELIGLGETMDGADLVLTGEGKLDGQTASGKTPAGVATLAQARGIPCLAVAGSLGQGYQSAYDTGITAAFSIVPGPMALAQSQRQGAELLADRARNLARLWRTLCAMQ